MRCSQCEKQIATGAQFCPWCGSAVIDESSTEVSSTDVPSTDAPSADVPGTAAPGGFAPTRVDVPISTIIPTDADKATADAAQPVEPPAVTPPPAEAAPPAAPTVVSSDKGTAGPPPPPPATPPPSTPPPSLPPFAPSNAGGADPWSLVTDAWSRTRSLWVALAVGFLGVGLLAALIGLLNSSFGSLSNLSVYHGQTWASFGGVLAVLALAAAAVGRTQAAVWSKELDLKVGAALAGIGLFVGLIGLIIVLSAGAARASVTGPVWESFASIWAFGAFAWVVFTRPIDRAQGLTVGIRSGAVAVVLAIVGLGVGLGDTGVSIVHSEGWFGWAGIWALIAAAAVFGREPAA